MPIIFKPITEELKRLVEKSIVLLVKHDSDLLKRDVREESISHRLAFYIENDLQKVTRPNEGELIVVDCEYDKHADVKKTLSSEYLTKYHKKSDIVRPDIVLHRRGDDGKNLLIIEVKKRKGKNIQYAKDKIRAFVNSSYQYQLGAYIEFSTDRTPKLYKGTGKPYKIEWFQKVDQAS